MLRILYIAKKEFIQVFRDPRMVGIIFIAPIFQLFVFGYAITTDVKDITVAVMDQDKSQNSRDVTRAIFNSGYFTNAGSVESDEDIAAALVHTKADLVIVIPEDFSKCIAKGQTANLQIIMDGGESNSAAVGMGYLGKTLVSFGQGQIETRMSSIAVMTQGKLRSLPIVNAETRFRYNPELKSSMYLVPGVLAMILMIITLMLTSLAITREREIGTMEQLVVTPIKPYQFMLGKMLPFVVIGLVDVTIILIVAVGHFDLPIRGSLPLLYFAAILFLFTTLGMGLLISTVSHTQQQAIFVSFMFTMPAILLSGLMFPIANMPDPVQWLAYLNPFTHFLIIIRGIILKGNGFFILAPQFFMLFALGLMVLALAVSRFQKTID
jgi:drug efflux transport system permease protein